LSNGKKYIYWEVLVLKTLGPVYAEISRLLKGVLFQIVWGRKGNDPEKEGSGIGIKNPDRERGRLRLVSQTIFSHTIWKSPNLDKNWGIVSPDFFL